MAVLSNVVPVETKAVIEGLEVVHNARSTGGVAVVLGRSGLGKTTMLREYALREDAGRALLYRAEVVEWLAPVRARG